ncbi:MAG: hypothetical protein G01um101413_506 [Parcubacteria group bacterium Gr01-1014_13]|nr:MAG: hypothetical protein G01um101413_506 [Parcubacteria group bacterium Gr01-1014_13]
MDDGGGTAGSAFTTAVTVSDGTTTSTLSANSFFVATSSSNLNGLFLVDSAGGVSASGTLRVFGASTLAATTITTGTVTFLNFQNATGTSLAVPTIIPSTGAAGTLTIGAAAGTGLITVGNSTLNQTLSLGIGTSSTVNIGTGPGTTTIKIGTGGAFGGIHIGATGITTTIDGGLTIAGIGVTSTNLNISGITNLAGTTITSVTTTNLNVTGALTLPANSVTDAMVVDTITASNYLLLTGGTLSGAFGFTTATGTSVTSTNAFFTTLAGTSLNISASSTFRTSTIAGGFFQTDFTDCSADSQTVNYDATTGKFTCLTDSGGGAPSSIFATPVTVTDGVTTSSLRADGLFIATSTTNLFGLFFANSAGSVSASGTLTVYGTSTFKNDVTFSRNTSTIFIQPSGSLSINRSDSTTSSLLIVKDMNNNFGSAVTAGAFIQRNSYFGEEFNIFRRGNCTITTTMARGDAGFYTNTCVSGNGSFSVATSSLIPYPGGGNSSNRGTFVVQSLNGVVNGIERIQITTAATQSSTAVNEYLGGNASGGTAGAGGNFLWATNTLPIFTAKVRPSNVSAVTSSVRYWVGFFGAPTTTASMMAPTTSPDGVYFTNCKTAANQSSYTTAVSNGAGDCNSTSWIGMIKSGTNIATTSCSVADSSPISSTTGFNYLRIEFVSSSAVRFLVDSNTANGVREVDCGTITVNPASYSNLVNMTVFAAMFVLNPSITARFDIDYFRVWQDDNVGGEVGGYGPSTIPEAVTTTPDLVSLSSLGEIYPASDGGGDWPEGTLVSLDPLAPDGRVTSSSFGYDANLVGVTASSLGLTIDNSTISGIHVATHGRATVRVSTINGPIFVGDYLTSSAIPGVAMRATKAGAVIGQAVTSYYGEDVGTVVASINKTNYLGSQTSSSSAMGSESLLSYLISSGSTITSSTYANTTSSALSMINADKVVAGLELVSPKVTTLNLLAGTISSFVSSSLKFNISSDNKIEFISGSASATSTIATIDGLGNAVFTGEVTASKINGLIPGLADLQTVVSTTIDRVGVLESSIQTISASLTSTQEQLLGLLSSSSTPTPTSTTLDISMFTKNSGLQFEYMVSFKEGLQTDSIGSISGTTTLLSDIIFFGRPYLNSDSGGYAMVASGTKEVVITFDNEYLDKPVIQVTMSFAEASSTEQESSVFSEDIRYIVSRATTKGFAIVLNKTAPFDVRFDWLALAIKNPKLFGVVTSSPVVFDLTPPPQNTPPVTESSIPSTTTENLEPADTPTTTPVQDSSPTSTQTEQQSLPPDEAQASSEEPSPPASNSLESSTTTPPAL